MLDNILFISIKEYLKSNLKPSRYRHSLGVADTACFIGGHNNLDLDILYVSSLLHDISKYMSLDVLRGHCIRSGISFDEIEGGSHGLLHSYVSAILARELYGIDDPVILNAITSHTMGRVNMSPYEEVVFVADFCEPSRGFNLASELIEKSCSNLRSAVFDVLSLKLVHIIKSGFIVHPRSVSAYNYYRSYSKA